MLGKLGKFLGGGVAKPIRDIAGTFVAPRDQRQMNEQEFKLAVLQQFSDYTKSDKGTFFERCVGALNALPRPIMALGAIALIPYAMFDKAHGIGAFAGLSAVPPEVWNIIYIIVPFYFGSRIQTKHLNAKEKAQRLENMERTANLIMDMNDRLDSRLANNAKQTAKNAKTGDE